MKEKLLTGLGVLCCALTSCAGKAPSDMEFTLKTFETSVQIHTDEQKEYLESVDPNNYIRNHSMDLASFSKSAPKAVELSWDVLLMDSNLKPKKYVVELKSDKGDMTFETKTNSLKVYNLYIDATYTWTVTAVYSGVTFTSNESTFTIEEQGPRNIFAEGVENLRDLGGWKLTNDKTYKQGLIYRSAELNGASNGLSKPTKVGKDTLNNQLKIKTEIDLRKTVKSFDDDEVYGITSSPLGKNVNYVSCPMVFEHSNIFTNPKDKESGKLFFETLADEDNYPVLFHCVRGTDRTGALAYGIGAMCGMSEEDLMKDYLFSNFANINSNVILESNINTTSFYVNGINKSEGSTLSEKAMNYVSKNYDVSLEKLTKIVNLLTE